jgi:hypothetical protein
MDFRAQKTIAAETNFRDSGEEQPFRDLLTVTKITPLSRTCNRNTLYFSKDHCSLT